MKCAWHSKCPIRGNLCSYSCYDHYPNYMKVRWQRWVFSSCELLLKCFFIQRHLGAGGDCKWVQTIAGPSHRSINFFPFHQPFTIEMVVTAWNSTIRTSFIYFRPQTPGNMQNSLGKKTFEAVLNYQYLNVNKCQILYRKPILLEWKKNFQARMRG